MKHFITLYGIVWNPKTQEQEEHLASLGFDSSMVICVTSPRVWNAIINPANADTIVEDIKKGIEDLVEVSITSIEGWENLDTPTEPDVTIHD